MSDDAAWFWFKAFFFLFFLPFIIVWYVGKGLFLLFRHMAHQQAAEQSAAIAVSASIDAERRQTQLPTSTNTLHGSRDAGSQ